MKTIYNSLPLKLKNNIIYLIAFTGIAFSLVSCQEPLNVDYTLTGDSVLCVEAKITTDTTSHFVLLSKTVPLNQKDVIWETGAKVSITKGNTIFNLTETNPGHYYTNPNVYGEIGQHYNLNIELKNGQVYTASTYINNISEIDSIKFSYEEYENYGFFFHYLYFFGKELDETGNAYLWNLKLNDTLYNDSVWKTSFVDDAMVNGNYIGINWDTNSHAKGSFPIYTLSPEDIKTDTVKVEVEMESIPHDYYDFLTTLMQQTVWVGSPFDATKADPLTNISNGAIGFFYGASIKRYSFVYIPPEASKNVKQPVFSF